jgi:hypothetical protein
MAYSDERGAELPASQTTTVAAWLQALPRALPDPHFLLDSVFYGSDQLKKH